MSKVMLRLYGNFQHLDFYCLAARFVKPTLVKQISIRSKLSGRFRVILDCILRVMRAGGDLLGGCQMCKKSSTLYQLTNKMQQTERPEVKQCVALRPEHLEEAKEVFVEGFLTSNEIWGTFAKREEVVDFFDRVVRSHIANEARMKKVLGREIQLNSVALYKGKILGSMLHYELEDYLRLQQQEKPEKLTLFRELQRAGRQLMEGIDLQRYPKGKTAFINFGSIPLSANLTAYQKVLMFVIGSRPLKQTGFEWIVGRISNVRALYAYQKLGGRCIKEMPFQLGGKWFKLYFVQMDLNNEAFVEWDRRLDREISAGTQISPPKL